MCCVLKIYGRHVRLRILKLAIQHDVYVNKGGLFYPDLTIGPDERTRPRLAQGAPLRFPEILICPGLMCHVGSHVSASASTHLKDFGAHDVIPQALSMLHPSIVSAHIKSKATPIVSQVMSNSTLCPSPNPHTRRHQPHPYAKDTSSRLPLPPQTIDASTADPSSALDCMPHQEAARHH